MRWYRLARALPVALLCACGKTVIIGQGTAGQLSYHCGSFKAQVQSDEQKEALFESARPLISWAAARDDRAHALSIRGALEHHDVVELEWLTVQYRCAHDSL